MPNNPTVQNYEAATLTVLQYTLVVQTIGIIVAVGSLIFLGIQVKEQVRATEAQVVATEAQVRATEAQYESLEASVYQDLIAKSLDVDKLLIDNPKLGHYFDQNSLGYAETDIPPEAYAAASYYLDFYQLVWSSRWHIKSLQDKNGADWTGWKNTMAASFKQSKFLCDHLAEINHDYGKEFVKYIYDNNWCIKP